MTLPWGLPVTRSRAWLLVPAVLGLMVVGALVLSNFQHELGLAEPGASGRAAVAAAAAADRALADGVTHEPGEPGGSLDGAEAYETFSSALRVALVSRRNMIVSNPVDIELDHLLQETLAYHRAARSAWQAEIDGSWDPTVHGESEYWRAAYPGLEPPDGSLLRPADVVLASRTRAAELLARAVDMVAD